LPETYFKRLQILGNMRKLVSDVTQTLLDKIGVRKDEIEGIISRFERGEYRGMFEGIIEGYKKSYRWGYRQAKARYERRHQQEREQLQEQLRQRDERIRQLEEENNRLLKKQDTVGEYQALFEGMPVPCLTISGV
jgi:hypothetical protein